ncbi:E3 ubiquitin-protein ligase PUB23-like [Diospyros lotus]|uniref:E3 ubiquitin-protein ligase PUB23-like n=1 Tax=Diospyros lotus TaxID=55363 RepID=UPI0022526672|nr:E3 ubiquitin-protein ligase PUB23-like [Diospyros lotus]
MDEIEVPPFFLCPISLEMMKDPVTVPTGITYERESIERWIFSGKNKTCPVTKQVLSDPEDLTPNHTLRRLIQSWCTLNASHGIERFPTPKPPVNKAQILKLLNSAKSPQKQMNCLRELKSIGSASEANKRCIESAGAVDFLASLVSFKTNASALEEVPCDDAFEFTSPGNEALRVLYNLRPSEASLKSLSNSGFTDSLLRVMQRGDYESRAYAVFLMKSILEVAEYPLLTNLKPEFFIEIIQLLHDQISSKASKASLQLLINAIPWARNQAKAVEAGAVPVLVDLLVDSPEKRISEMILVVLDLLCHCAEGRAELLKHGAGLAVVSKKILRVSRVGSEMAMRILLSVSKYSASPSVVEEMLQLGVVAKLCLVLQLDAGNKAKEKAREILKLHARAWKDSSCLPLTLRSSYPS